MIISFCPKQSGLLFVNWFDYLIKWLSVINTNKCP